MSCRPALMEPSPQLEPPFFCWIEESQQRPAFSLLSSSATFLRVREDFNEMQVILIRYHDHQVAPERSLYTNWMCMKSYFAGFLWSEHPNSTVFLASLSYLELFTNPSETFLTVNPLWHWFPSLRFPSESCGLGHISASFPLGLYSLLSCLLHHGMTSPLCSAQAKHTRCHVAITMCSTGSQLGPTGPAPGRSIAHKAPQQRGCSLRAASPGPPAPPPSS
nr:uncharacterized protein LOC129164837 [Nothobranchius furzeri]